MDASSSQRPAYRPGIFHEDQVARVVEELHAVGAGLEEVHECSRKSARFKLGDTRFTWLQSDEGHWSLGGATAAPSLRA